MRPVRPGRKVHLRYAARFDARPCSTTVRGASRSVARSVARSWGVGTFSIFPGDRGADPCGRAARLRRAGSYYYCTDRAYHPCSVQFLPWHGVDHIACFDAARFIALIAPRPLLMIAGREAGTSHMTTDAIAKVQEPKELFRVDGATHVDPRDEEEYLTPRGREARRLLRDPPGRDCVGRPPRAPPRWSGRRS
jgi:fermentation-respiration switch protein FrsA (DUF1100 family)